MRTGFAALKYGTTLALVPLTFVYVPELLLQGTAAEIAMATVAYFLGYAALAMGIQRTEFFGHGIVQWRRALFFVAALCLLSPVPQLVRLMGVAVMLAAWAPHLLEFRRSQFAR